MHINPLIFQIFILFSCSVVLITLFYRLRLPPLMAFLLIGAFAGPSGFALVDQPEELHLIAELGLTFLLFLLGLEFSLPKLIALRDTVIKLGGAQVGLFTVVFAIAFYWWGLNWETSLLVGGALALSSTAIVSRELSQLGKLHGRFGQIAIGVLLFQDIVAVLLISAIPMLAADSSASASSHFDWQTILIPLGKGIFLLTALLAIGRYVLPRFLAEIARNHSEELLVLSALVIVLAAGLLTTQMGLSMELGAFLAGMMLGESRFKHQLEADVRPFRDIFLGLFFISIGMLIEPGLVKEYWLRILACGLLLVLFKGAVFALIARVFGEPWQNALPAALTLAQGGEFLFALLALATRDQLIASDVAAFLICVTIVSMVLTPVCIRNAESFSDLILKRLHKKKPADDIDPSSLPQANHHHLENHVVILGFGRVGQTVARFLKIQQIPYLALETDIVRIMEASAGEEPVFYGDPARLDILKSSAIHKAKLVVISFDDVPEAIRVLKQIRELNATVPVLVRTRDDTGLNDLQAAGATEVVPETLEASLMLVSHVLMLLKTPTKIVHELVNEARLNRYQLLHGFYHGNRVNTIDEQGNSRAFLHAITLDEKAWAKNKSLLELALVDGLVIREVHRSEITLDLHADIRLQSGDVLLLEGSIKKQAWAEDYLLSGKV